MTEVWNHPWGECVAFKCHTVGVRCYHDRCSTHCEEMCVDQKGTRTHSLRTKAEENALTPSYTPTKAKLVATTTLKEEAA